MKKLLVALGLALALPALAQNRLVVSTGAEKGSTYTQMFGELRDLCQSPGLSLETRTSSGAIENMDRIVGNKVNAGIVQTDIIWLRGKTDNLSNVKTLLALHPEEVHVVVLAAGWRLGATDFFRQYVPREVGDLRGRTVGAAGGSVITAKVVSQLGKVGFAVLEFPSTGAALAALGKDVDAVVAVGGAPLGSLEALDSRYKLLEFSRDMQELLAQVYTNAKVSYPRMNSAGVNTVATEALLVTQDYKTPAYRSSLVALRACLARNLDNLREGIGMHPKWKSVEVENHGKWPWYEGR